MPPISRECSFTPAEMDALVTSFVSSAADNGIEILQVAPAQLSRSRQSPGPGLWIREDADSAFAGQDVPCRVVGKDELGNWCVLTEWGATLQVFASEVY